MGKTTDIYYQVEANGFVHESMCFTLKEAKILAKTLQGRGCSQIQIARYDRSGKSDYYEVIVAMN